MKNLIFFGSSCIYPKNINKPIKEDMLLSGKLEYTNEPYAIAKIAGIKMCESYNKQFKTNYKCLMPCNSYGINDNCDPNTSFLPALIRKIIFIKNKKDYIKSKIESTSRNNLMMILLKHVYFLNKKQKNL